MSVIADLTGNIIKADGFISSAPQMLTLTGNAGTATSYIMQCTTPSLTTAGAAVQAEVITLAGVTTANVASVTYAGGTNTTTNISFKAVCTANTVTVTIINNTAATALNGTVVFNVTVS